MKPSNVITSRRFIKKNALPYFSDLKLDKITNK
ncbi:MAG: hypothetical protein ABS911_11680 [Carnobacterium sp.]